MKGDGDSAFPVFMQDSANNAYHIGPGMSLRDYFAGQALVGIVSADMGAVQRLADKTQTSSTFMAARIAYDFADAMLKAR